MVSPLCELFYHIYGIIKRVLERVINMRFEYKPKGVCSTKLVFEIEGDKILDLKVVGGCNGNLQGISSLVKFRSVDEVIDCLSDIKCGMKNTSCPDQIACALRQYKNEVLK